MSIPSIYSSVALIESPMNLTVFALWEKETHTGMGLPWGVCNPYNTITIHPFVHASATHVIRWMHHFVAGLSMFSCSYWIHAGFEASHLSFIVFLLCLIPDYHCELLSSICYCTNDEMNVFKQHLNWWQKLQLLQWLSPLISHHFSNQNQKRLLAFTFFPP